MSKSMNPIAAPKTLRYEPDAGLPVAIEAKSNRRYPTNGDKFGPDQTNVIRMTLNSNSFIDFSHSYLQFTVENTSSVEGGVAKAAAAGAQAARLTKLEAGGGGS